MKTLMYSILILSSIFSPIQAREGGYGGFTRENIQEFNDYVNGLEMIKVQKGDALDQAIDAIPISLETAIGLDQESGLRDWLRQYLIAFSESGNDSLVAVFYLRTGFNAERYKKQQIGWAKLYQESAQKGVVLRNEDGDIMTDEEIVNIVEKTRTIVEKSLSEQSPLSILHSEHRKILTHVQKEYFIENVSFHDSEFRIFELNKRTPTFFNLAEDQNMLPKGFMRYPTALAEQLPAFLEAGKRIICADILFIVEEPSKTAYNPTMPGRTPSFFRLLWDQDKKLWCHLEVFYSPGVAEAYLFDRF